MDLPKTVFVIAGIHIVISGWFFQFTAQNFRKIGRFFVGMEVAISQLTINQRNIFYK